MNTQHLQYIIEIERTRSISQAADNLYIGQPNLSRILHDMEERMGYPIFERTSRGVHPTQKGAQFLRHAQSILREMEQIESIGSAHAEENQLRVCIPRSARYSAAIARYIAGLDASQALDASVRESHVRLTISRLANGDTDIGIVRYRREYQDYFREQAAQAGLNFVPLKDFKYVVVVSQKHPLAEKQKVTQEELSGYTEIAHGGDLRTGPKVRRRVQSVERMAQLTILRQVPGAYLWMEPPEEAFARAHGLVCLECEDNAQVYRDTLVYPKKDTLSAAEQGLLELLRARFKEEITEE